MKSTPSKIKKKPACIRHKAVMMKPSLVYRNKICISAHILQRFQYALVGEKKYTIGTNGNILKVPRYTITQFFFIWCIKVELLFLMK